jgi:hypothetical protein
MLKCSGTISKALKNIESANLKGLALLKIFKALAHTKKEI